MKSPRIALAAAVAVALAVPALAEDLTVVYKTTSASGAGTATAYFSSTAMRTSDGNTESIVQYGAGRIIGIDHKRKEYSEITLAEMEAGLARMQQASAQMQQQMAAMPPAVRERMEQMMGGAAAVTLTKGGVRKVAGYDCQEWVIAAGTAFTRKACATTAVAAPAVTVDQQKLAGLASSAMGMANNPMFKSMAKVAEEMKKIQGFQLAESTSMTMMGQHVQSSKEAIEVKKGPIPASTFDVATVAKGYKKIPHPMTKMKRRSTVPALVDATRLARELSSTSRDRLRVVDVRWYLDPARMGREAWRAGHIPGAVFLDVDLDLSAPGGGRGLPLGRHPWPVAEQVARVMSAVGIGPGVEVVAYDDSSGGVAARLWYLLRAHGHEQVSVLDGGLASWLAEGRPLSTDEPRVRPTTFSGGLRPGFVVEKGELAASHRERLLLDARVPERYRGEREPVDPRAGHIPGARNAPWTENLTADRVPLFRPPGALRRHYEALGAGQAEAVVYCGSGVNACHDLLALHLAGLRGSLYPGSWSEWSSDPALPAASGDE